MVAQTSRPVDYVISMSWITFRRRQCGWWGWNDTGRGEGAFNWSQMHGSWKGVFCELGLETSGCTTECNQGKVRSQTTKVYAWLFCCLMFFRIQVDILRIWSFAWNRSHLGGPGNCWDLMQRVFFGLFKKCPAFPLLFQQHVNLRRFVMMSKSAKPRGPGAGFKIVFLEDFQV